MRGKAIFAVLVTLFMMTPVQAGEVAAMQTQQDDPKQPSQGNTTMYIYSDGNANYWSHFSDNDTDSVAEWSDEDDERNNYHQATIYYDSNSFQENEHDSWRRN